METNKESFSRPVKMYDCSLRDGAQDPHVRYTLDRKLQTAAILDRTFRMDYIEGGWPGSNPLDTEFFQRANNEMEFTHARLVAFGSTRHKDSQVEEDRGLKALLDAKTPVIALVGKASLFQAETILGTSGENNLRMIEESVRFLKEQGREVVFDAEHFFNGYAGYQDAHDDPGLQPNPGYALEALRAAARGGADWAVLCDTNGGMLPNDVYRIVRTVGQDRELHEAYRSSHHLTRGRMPIGIHAHDDQHVAVANTLQAIKAGATQVQGTMNGGERIGNLDILTVMLIRTLKQGVEDIPSEQLIYVKAASDEIRALAGLAPDPKRPFVGDDAAAHKAGLHAHGIRLNPRAYQHFVPEAIGNRSRVIISELSGRNNIEMKLEELEFPFPVTPDFSSAVTNEVKRKTAAGYDYVSADASFEMLARRLHPQYKAPYELQIVRDNEKQITASLHLHETGEAAGQISMLPLSTDTEQTFSKIQNTLSASFPHLTQIELVNCNTHPENGHMRTIVHVRDKEKSWTTVGANINPQLSGFEAIHDALEYAVCHPASPEAAAER